MMTPVDDSKTSLFRYRFASAEFDEARFELTVSGMSVEVQRKPLEILAYLLAHAGEVVTKDELLDVVWAGRPTVENVIANAIAKLRSALGPGNADRIVTHPRIGYRFAGAVERTAVGRTATSRLDLAAGMSVPGRASFALESLLGQPGAGEVWTARHRKTREVRVYKFSSDGERLASLKREATLFRVLRDSLGERSDFARIIDWNFETPPFFLECEYGGRNLLDWTNSEDGLRTMSLAERLELFVQIAEAVAAAHSVGVLHKDLKPANVLITARPDGTWQARLTDFGSGRLLESERLEQMGITRLGLTATKSVLADSDSGTPLYLAPELLAGQSPTVQTDVYALGVMLYQIVVADLRKPMVPGWERDVGDPLLCDDVAAATDGDPARRIASATELATHLRNLEPRRDERRQRDAAELAARAAALALQRARARRPWIAAAGVALAVGLGVSTWLYRGAQIAAERVEAINEFLYRDVLANTGALKTDSDADPSMRRVLRNAAAIVGDRFAGDPSSEGWIRLAIGQGLSGLGDYDGAEEQHHRAVELLKDAHGSGHERTLVATYALAMLLLEQSKFGDAEAVLADIDLVTGAERTDETAFKTHALRGMLRAERKECAAALEDLRAATLLSLPSSAESAFNIFNARSWIGESLNCLGRYSEAEAHYAELLGAGADENVLGPVIVAYARLGYATALLHSGRDTTGERELLAALRSLETAVGDTDAFTMGQALVVAGGFYAELGRFEPAASYLNRGRELLLAVGEQQEKALSALRALGTIDYRTGQVESAVAKLTQARDGLSDVYGPQGADVQGADYWLAAAFAAAGQVDEAAELVESLDPEALRASLGGPGWPARLDALRARVLIRQGRAAQGGALLETAIAALERDGVPAWVVDSVR
jgi:eukaryotic-like serine/threonine-protein kinase